MITANLAEKVLIDPIRRGMDSLFIIAGYATPTMASWHIKQIQMMELRPIEIKLVVGMCCYDGLTADVHEGFKALSEMRNSAEGLSSFTCQYVFEGPPVHSKLFIWSQEGIPYEAYAGSANYTQVAFGSSRRELLTQCDPLQAYDYFNQIEAHSMFCTHPEIEQYIMIRSAHPVLDGESPSVERLRGLEIRSVTLSFITRTGDTGARSGLNWGQRPGREPNQAYIPLPSHIARSGFFPLNGKHFAVTTDDGKQLILRVEQANDKAITTPLNNSQIGEYFRNRLGLPNGAYVSRADLERYGRTDVTFYKLDEETYFMDFSV